MLFEKIDKEIVKGKFRFRGITQIGSYFELKSKKLRDTASNQTEEVRQLLEEVKKKCEYEYRRYFVEPLRAICDGTENSVPRITSKELQQQSTNYHELIKTRGKKESR